MTRKARTTIALLLIALMIVACQQASTQTKEAMAETKSESEDTNPTDPEEQYQLEAYYNGEGVVKDWNQATHWWRKAAEQGHAGAQAMIGIAYFSGEGVEQNYTESYAWFILAKPQGEERRNEPKPLEQSPTSSNPNSPPHKLKRPSNEQQNSK